MKPLIILACEVTAEAAPSYHAACGEFGPSIEAGVGLPGRAIYVTRDEAPPAPEDIGGLVITGSASMVADPLPWIVPTADYCRRALAAGVPTLGICFGHQLLAHALGGRVAEIDGQPEYGTVEVARTAAAAQDALFGHLPDRFLVQAAHYQNVAAAPPGATLLASNDTGIHALRFAPLAWGVQFHPEFSPEGARIIHDIVRADLQARGQDVEADRARIGPTPFAASVLRRFGEIVTAAA
ncbi:gamma-glutamyl-gamma-aminobutyrate hydrolase family protein [Pseudoxanthobacter sp.]|uniref:glutamine amidotransferase-related protein n=1 Tax=Pseudoxanthobacter sp. TaxID=1925742 RepID=UPI002FE13107